jgi:hypothetical protein
MMKAKLCLYSCFFYISLTASASADEPVVFATLFPGDGNVFEYRINPEDLLKMPSWKVEKELPPIDPKKALLVAREYLKKNREKYANSVVSEIKMERFKSSKTIRDKWYYTITFMKSVPVDCSVPDTTSVFIMMDGTVNEPVLAKFDPQMNFKSPATMSE